MVHTGLRAVNKKGTGKPRLGRWLRLLRERHVLSILPFEKYDTLWHAPAVRQYLPVPKGSGQFSLRRDGW